MYGLEEAELLRAQLVQWIAVGAVAGFSLAACDGDGGGVGADVPTFEPEDTGTADTGPGEDAETGSDAEEDVTVRRVIDRGLFGEMPADNRVLDPLFRSRSSWIPFEVRGDRPVGVSEGFREVRTETPRSAPLLRAPETSGSTRLQLLGGVALNQRPLRVEIWIGRPDEFDDSADVALLGVTADSPSETSTAELTPGEEREVGEVKWTRYSASVTGFFGRGFLRVRASGDEALLLHAPVVTEARAGPGALSRFDDFEVGAADELDRTSIERARQWQRRQRPDPEDVLLGPAPDLFEPAFAQ